MSNNKITCENCGHTNYLHIQPVQINVEDLQPTDIGLRIDTPHKDYVMIEGFGVDEKTQTRYVDYSNPGVTLTYGDPDVGRLFFREPTPVTIYRPVG